jgi:hypothetical protein
MPGAGTACNRRLLLVDRARMIPFAGGCGLSTGDIVTSSAAGHLIEGRS